MRITSPLFDAFLKCATKCHLRSLGEIGSGNEFAEWVRVRDESYRHEAARGLQEAVSEDHVHLLAGLARTCSAAEVVKEVKRGSSLWAKERDAGMRDFSWQNGYGIFSIGASQIEDVRRCIAEQEQHHRKLSFQDEFRLLLKRYELAYDERYVWD